MAKSKLSKIRDQRAYVELCRCELEDAQARHKRAHATAAAAALQFAKAEIALEALENDTPEATDGE